MTRATHFRAVKRVVEGFTLYTCLHGTTRHVTLLEPGHHIQSVADTFWISSILTATVFSPVDLRCLFTWPTFSHASPFVCSNVKKRKITVQHITFKKAKLHEDLKNEKSKFMLYFGALVKNKRKIIWLVIFCRLLILSA